MFSFTSLKRLLVIASFVVLSNSGLGADDSKTVRLLSSEYPPFFSKKLENYGAVSEIITKAFEKSGYKVSIEFRPWARALDQTTKGAADGMFALWHNAEREKIFLFSEGFVLSRR